MTNLTADKARPHKEAGFIDYGLVGYTDYQSGSTAYTVYKGAIMMMDVSDIDGYAQPMLSTITAASGDVFLGVAMEQASVTSSDTSQGDVKVTVATRGIWGFPVASLAVTDIGAPIYATDDDAVQTSSTNALWIGTLVAVDDTYAWIDISTAAGRANSAT